MSTPGTLNYPSALDDNISIFQAANRVSTALNGSLTNVATTATVLDTSAFPSTGALSIDAEVIYYTGKTSTTFTGLIRGADGTSAVSHTNGSTVTLNIVARHHNVLADAIIAVETKLGISSDTPAASEFLKGTGAGTSAWSALTSGEITTALGFTPANKAGDTFTGAVTINGFGAAAIGFTVRAAASQIANLTEWKNSAGNLLYAIGPNGELRMPPTCIIDSATAEVDPNNQSLALIGKVFPKATLTGVGPYSVFTQSPTIKFTANPPSGTIVYGNSMFLSTDATEANDLTNLDLRANYAYAFHYANSNISSITGMATRCENDGSGTVGIARSLWVRRPNNLGAGAITNCYGIFIDALSTGTNRWQFFSAGTELSEFSGPLKAVHLIGGGSTPAIAQSGAGSGASVSVSGNDTSGEVTLNTGSSGMSNPVSFMLTFATAYSSAPRVVLQPSNANAGVGNFVTTTTTTATVSLGSLSTSTTYKWFYHVIQ